MNSLPIELPPLLAIETSTAVCAVGACVDGEIFEDTRYLERLHNQQALSMIDGVTASIRQRFGSKFTGFGLVAFGRGPGSFTGVRIGAALAQGIAFAHNAQVLPLASLQVQAEALLEHRADAVTAEDQAVSAQTCVVFVRSRQQMYYVQAFSCLDAPDSGQIREPDSNPWTSKWESQSGPDLVQDYDEWQAWLEGLGLEPNRVPTLLGQQPLWLQEGKLTHDFVPDVAITAAAVLRVGVSGFARGNAVAPELGLPEYLSADSPWKPSA